MTLEKQYGEFIFICDVCEDHFESKWDSFFDALAQIQQEGWLVKRNDDDTEWLHICNECVKGNR